MEEVISTEIPELVAEVASADFTPIIERLDMLINISFSTYAWLALFITLLVGGWCIYILLKPLLYFIQK